MAFRYALQTLLRLRESLERQEERRLFAIAALVNRLRAEIEQLHQDRLDVRSAAFQEMAAGSSGASLRFATICEAAFEAAREKLQLQLNEAERRRLHQLREYQIIRQKREILQDLRDRQEAAYELDFARHEQQLADEVFLIRAHSVPEE